MVDFRLGNRTFSGRFTCQLCLSGKHSSPAALDLHGYHASVCPYAEGCTSRYNDFRDWIFREIRCKLSVDQNHTEEPLPQDAHPPETHHRRLDIYASDLSLSSIPRDRELYFNIRGGTLPQRALKQLWRACNLIGDD